MDFDLKLAMLKSGKRQWEIAQEAGISESKLSKHLHGYAPLNDTERERLDEVLGQATGKPGVSNVEGQ
jgi:hypothetical protein